MCSLSVRECMLTVCGCGQELVVDLCSGEQAVLPSPAVQAGTRSLLNTMGLEDVMGDAPKAADWVTPPSLL